MIRRVLLLAVALGARLAAPGAEPVFSFAHITDTHLHDEAWIRDQQAQGIPNGYRNYQITPGKFRQCIEWINRRPDLDFIALTGDMTETASPVRYQTLESIMSDVTIPWVVTPGNHDYGLERLLPDDLSRGGLDFGFTWRGVRFLGFQTFNPPGMSHLVSRETMEKIAHDLASHRDAPAILLCHSPLVTREGGAESWEVPTNAAEFRQVLLRCGNVVAVACGHDHSFWWRVEDGILHVCGPGFCEALGAPAFACLVWQVYADRIECELHAVADDGQVARVPADRIVCPLPERFAGRPAANADAFRVEPRPAPGASLLEDWFGPDWVCAPGFALPPSWREDRIVLPREAEKPASVLSLTDAAAAPPPDEAGRPWYHPDYRASAAWQPCTLPDGYWNSREPRGGHAGRFYRIPFAADAETVQEMRRGAFKILVYRTPAAYLNGEPVKVYGGGHAAYWNGCAVFEAGLLRASTNLLAVRLITSGWGGYKLDVEIGAELATPTDATGR